MVEPAKTSLRWAFAGCKPQGVQVLSALCEAGLRPEFCAAPPELSPEDDAALLELVRREGLELHRSLRLDGFQARLAALDLLMTCRFEILPSDVFEAPRLGGINIHSSLLPRYRGVHPVSWALVNGEAETGITIHRIAKGVDTGDILAQRAVAIADQDDLWSLTAKLNAASVQEAVRLLRQVAGTGVLPPAIEQSGPASYAPRRTPKQSRISWSASAREIANLVRALPPPLPLAFCTGPGGDVVTLRCARLVFGVAQEGKLRAGEVLSASDDGEVHIMCADGNILSAVPSMPLCAGDVLR